MNLYRLKPKFTPELKSKFGSFLLRIILFKNIIFSLFCVLYRKTTLKMRHFIIIFYLLCWVLQSSAQTPFLNQLADSAFVLTKQKVVYDPSYFSIAYPNGDVPADKGVCTDVIIRAYRKLGIDLQKLVHEDMRVHFSIYPQMWKLKGPNKNIDHRRVPNLMTFFKRKGIEKPITKNGKDYVPGAIVCWNLGGGINHIGIVSNVLTKDKQRYLIIHNVGAGQVLEDFLFQYKIIGHYHYAPTF